jgi:hypothetical protein
VEGCDARGDVVELFEEDLREDDAGVAVGVGAEGCDLVEGDGGVESDGEGCVATASTMEQSPISASRAMTMSAIALGTVGRRVSPWTRSRPSMSGAVLRYRTAAMRVAIMGECMKKI